MDYVLGVLYATKKYELLDSSRVNVSRGSLPLRQGRALRLPSAASVSALSGAAADAAGASANATDTDTAAHKEDDNLPPHTGAGHSGQPTLLSLATAGGVRVPAAMLPAHFADSRRPSASSVTSPGMPSSPCTTAHPSASPREPLCLLSPLVPGLSSSLAAHASTVTAAATAPGSVTRVSAPAIGGGVVWPQRLEYSVPTKAIAGKYVLLYLPPPHRPGESPAATLWGNHLGGAGAGAHSMSGSQASMGGGGASGGGPRSSANPASPVAALQSPHLDPIKPRLGAGASGVGPAAGSSGSNAFMGAVSPLTMSNGGSGGAGAPRPNFSASLSKSVDLSASLSTGKAAGAASAAGPTSPAWRAAVRAAAASVTTHQKLLLFYSLLLDHLARQRPTALDALDDADATGGGRVPVAVLELHCTTEGPVRTSAAVMPNGSGAGSMEGHGAALSASPAPAIGSSGGGGGGGGGGGAGSPPVSGGVSSLLAHNQAASAASPRNGPYGARVGPAPPGSGFGGGSGYVSNAVSAMASPRGSTGAPHLPNQNNELFMGRAEEAAGQRVSGQPDAVGDTASDTAATHRLGSMLRHLIDGQPDAWLSPDNVAFGSDITQNPYYGGWYSVESNDGYRRVMQMCGLRSWPAVVLVDPAGNVVTLEAMQHVEEELARFTDDVEASIAMAKAAALLAAAVAPSTATPDPRSGGSAVPSRRNSGAGRETAAAVGQGGAEQPTAPTGDAAPLRDTPSQPSSSSDTKAASATAAVATDQSGTHPLAAPLGRGENSERGAINACTASGSSAPANDSFSTPTRCRGSSELDSECHDTRVPTAEPTPVKMAPTTARYREESGSQHRTLPTGVTVATTAAPFPASAKSPLQTMDSLSDPHFLRDTQQYETSLGRVEVADDGADVLMGDTATRTRPRLATDDDSGSWRFGSRSGDLGSEPTVRPSPQLSMPGLQPPPPPQRLPSGSGLGTTSTGTVSPSSASATKGYGSLPSWDPKVYGGDVAGVLAVSEYDSDMDTPPHLRTVDVRRAASSKVATPAVLATTPAAAAAGGGDAGGDAAGKAKAGTAAAPSVSFFSHLVAADASKIVDDFIAVMPGAVPTPVAPPLPAFSTGFPWNHILAEPFMLYAPPFAAVVANAEERCGNGGTDGAKAEAPQRQSSSRRVGEANVARDEPNELDRTAGSSSTAGHAGTRRSTTPTNSSPTAMAVVPSAMVLRQAGLSQTPSLLSVTGSPVGTGALGCEQAANAPRESLTPRSGGAFGQRAPSTITTTAASAAAPAAGVGGAAQLELITFAESAPLTWTERQLPMHPLRRLAFCSVTVGEVRERSRQAPSDAVLTTRLDDLGKVSEQPAMLATLTQETVRQPSEDTPGESPVMQSLSLLDISDGASTRRSAAGTLRGGLPPSRLLPGNVTAVPGAAAAGRSPAYGIDPVTHRNMTRLIDTWQREAAVKFEGCTHLLVLFGAGWHPGMPKAVRAVRRLCKSLNTPAPPRSNNGAGGVGGAGVGAGTGASAVRAAAANGFGGGVGEEDGELSHVASGRGGGLNMRSYDRCVSAEDDDMDTFASLRGFRNSPMDWTGGSSVAAVASGGGFEDTSSHLDLRGFESFRRPNGGLSHTGVEDLERQGSSPPPAVVASAAASPLAAGATAADQASSSAAAAAAAAATLPRRRVQVMYISADDSISGVCAAVEEMPADWLCVSPHVAQIAPERALQTHANDIARYIFNVKSFPRLVVVELPYAQQQHQQPQQAQAPATSQVMTEQTEDGLSANIPNLSGAARDECEDDLGDATATVTTLYATSATSQQVLEQQFEGLWTVLQQHGEIHMHADPDGRDFPWASEPRDVLRLTQDDVSALSREGRLAWHTMMQGFRQQQDGTPVSTAAAACFTASSQASPLLGSESPDCFDETTLLQSHGELATTAPTPTKRGMTGSASASALATTIAPLLQSVTRLFPPVKKLCASDSELPTLLMRGGYLVVLAAFGSVDAQLHQQCFSVLDEVRRWFYAEVEARKQRAWSDSTPPQVTAPHGTYATSFSVGGDRVMQSPAHDSGGGVGEEHSTPTRYASGISASAVLGLTLAEHGPLHRHGVRGAPAHPGDEGWLEVRGTATPPKHVIASPPMPGVSTPLQVDGLHGLSPGGGPHQHHHYRGAPPAALSAAAAAATRPLPTVYFYDSILSHDAADEGGGRHAKPAGAAGAERACQSPAPLPRVSDNSASLRRRHAKDVALLQEYVIAPILVSDDKLLPVREGEVYLACVRWPQRTCAVLRRRLASEARPPTTTATGSAAASATVASGGGGSVSGSSPSSSATGSAGAGNPASGASPGLRSLASPQPSAQPQAMPEAVVRRPPPPPTTTTTAAGSPTPTSPTTSLAPNTSLAAAAVAGAAVPASSHSTTPSPSAATLSPAVNVAGGAATETNSPSLSAVNPPVSAATSLDNTLRTEGDAKEGSPDPDATPLLSAEAVKSFLHEHVLRSMDA